MGFRGRTRPVLRLFAFMLGLLIVGVAAAAQAQATGRAQLKDAQGRIVGTATLSEDSTGVRIVLRVTGLKPGEHGFHVHTIGKCEPPDFASAGGHFNPAGKKHGLNNPEGPHAGDLPNLRVGPDGIGSADATDARVTLKDGPTSLFQSAGTALIIHADPDDGKSDPAGKAGARVACGVIER